MADERDQVTEAVMEWHYRVANEEYIEEGPERMWLVQVPGSGNSWHSVYISAEGARYLEEYKGFNLRTTDEADDAPVVIHMPRHRTAQVEDDTYQGRHRAPGSVSNIKNKMKGPDYLDG